LPADNAPHGCFEFLDVDTFGCLCIPNVDMFHLAWSSNKIVASQCRYVPPYVEHIDIGYAKTAKRIDVKKLKTAMWSVVSRQAESASSSKEAAVPASTSSFASVLKRLSTALPANMVSNLSVPIAFVCLLHIANEKNLFITSTEQFSDLNIAVER